MLGSGLGVLVIGVVMGGLGGVFGAGWERRQVERYLERRSGRTLRRDVAASHLGDLSCANARRAE